MFVAQPTAILACYTALVSLHGGDAFAARISISMSTSDTVRPVAFRDEDSYQGEANRPAFRYGSLSERRRVADEKSKEYDGPPLNILLLGKPCSGKGTLAPMLARAYRCVFVSSGNLLRSEVKAETELGRVAREHMLAGGMMPTALMLSLIKRRLSQRDAATNGWILDGFPRTGRQAMLLLREKLIPDAVITLERSDELVKQVCLGRCTDSATGITYHPLFNPVPNEARSRLTWRLDDTEEVIEKRLEQFAVNHRHVLEQLASVPSVTIDTACNEIVAFQKIATFVDAVSADKLKAMGGRVALDALRRQQVDERSKDLEVPNTATDDGVTGLKGVLKPEDRTLVAMARRCNRYDMRQYLPVVASNEQVGWITKSFAAELTPYLGSAVDIMAGEHGQQTVVLAPYATSLRERTAVLAGMVQGLVDSGAIPRQAVRHELQDVRPMSRLGPGEVPLLRLERAAMIYFGVPSYGVHVNGFTVTEDGSACGPGAAMWVGVRSPSKATYPGLLDQIVAGGQPTACTFQYNVRKECVEEASIPASLLARLRPAGMVSYRFSTPYGLSTKLLAVYDLPLPPSFLPFNGDGEVEEFMSMSMEDVLASVRDTPEKWKPNSALVIIDFAMRHGLIDADDKDYVELAHLLRGGLYM